MVFKGQNIYVFSVDSGNGKNGFYSNIILLDMEDKSKLEIFCKDEQTANTVKENIGKNVNILLELKQNKFGLSISDILGISEVQEQKKTA